MNCFATRDVDGGFEVLFNSRVVGWVWVEGDRQFRAETTSRQEVFEDVMSAYAWITSKYLPDP